MPTSNIRTKKGRTPQKSKADLKRINESFYNKLDEYLLLSLDELKALEASKKVKGTYLQALTEAITQKTAIKAVVDKNAKTLDDTGTGGGGTPTGPHPK